jgi:hypothetical protein
MSTKLHINNDCTAIHINGNKLLRLSLGASWGFFKYYVHEADRLGWFWYVHNFFCANPSKDVFFIQPRNRDHLIYGFSHKIGGPS